MLLMYLITQRETKKPKRDTKRKDINKNLSTEARIMTTKRISRFLVFILLSVGLSACSLPIAKEYRMEVTKDVTFPMVLENPTAYVGDFVLWGGKIIETTNLKDGTEIIVLETPLNYLEEPKSEHQSEGRFIAKSMKFLDPVIYKKGRKITVAGEITGKETRSLGKADYAYPVLMVKQLHLWEPVHYRQDYYYGPWYDYYGPWYDPWYDPWFYPYYRPYYRPFYWGY